MLNKILNILNKNKPNILKPYDWFVGNYKTWDESIKECNGYNAPNILEKVRDSLLKVKNGEAVYERDSVLFDKIQYNQPLLIFLQYIALRENNKLFIVDFGGSLGSSYFQNKKYLNNINKVMWSVVEQPHFVEIGKKEFQDTTLNFYFNVEDAQKATDNSVLLLSCVLPYLNDPKSFINEMFNYNFKYIIVDRTPFFIDDIPDRLTIEIVPPEIYKAKYPAWFFNKNSFISLFEKKYKLFEEFDSWESWTTGGDKSQNKAFLFISK